MSFWDAYEPKAKPTPPPTPTAQNAPMPCSLCPHEGPDVLLGVCDACAED